MRVRVISQSDSHQGEEGESESWAEENPIRSWGGGDPTFRRGNLGGRAAAPSLGGELTTVDTRMSPPAGTEEERRSGPTGLGGLASRSGAGGGGRGVRG